MDDQELKSLWQSESPKKQQPNLEKTFKGKSIGILEKLQKTVKWEHYVNIIMSVLLVGFLCYEQKWWHAIGFSAFLLGVILYYKNLYDKVNNITYTENVVEYLTDTYSTLKDFEKRYIIGLIVIFPIAYALGFDVGYDVGHQLHGSEKIPERAFFAEPKEWMFFIVVNLITIAITAAITHFIFQFFYGKHIKKIKGMIDTLQSSETME